MQQAMPAIIYLNDRRNAKKCHLCALTLWLSAILSILAYPSLAAAQRSTAGSAMADDIRNLLREHRERLPPPRVESNQRRFGIIQSVMPKPFDIRQQKFLDAIDAYLLMQPTAPDRAGREYERARIYYDQGHHDKAVPIFRMLVEKYPKNDIGKSATIFLLDCLVIQSNVDILALSRSLPLLEVELSRIEKEPALMASMKIEEHVRQIKRDLLVWRTEQEEQSGNCDLAARNYANLTYAYPRDEKYAIFMEHAARNFEKCNLIGLAIEFYERLAREGLDDSATKRALLRAGQIYTRLAAYERSAETYETLARRFPTYVLTTAKNSSIREIDSPTALYAAIAYRRGVGHADQAIDDALLFIKTYGDIPEYIDLSAGIFLDIAQTYKQRIDYSRETQHYQEYLDSAWRKKGGMDREIVAEERLAELSLYHTCPVFLYSDGLCIEWVGMTHSAFVNQLLPTRTSQRYQQLALRANSLALSVRRQFDQIKKARDHLKAVLDRCTLFKGSKDHLALRNASKLNAAERLNEVLSACGRARIRLSDLDLEEWLSQQNGELQTDPERLAQLKRPYDELTIRTSEAIVLAQARIGLLYFFLATDQRVKAPLFEEYKHSAQKHLEHCVEQARDRYQIGLLAPCEKMLHELDPKKYPIQAEIFAEPGYNIQVLDRAPVVAAPLQSPNIP